MYETISILMSSVCRTGLECSLYSVVPIVKQDSVLSAFFEISLTLKMGKMEMNATQSTFPSFAGEQWGQTVAK